MERELGLQLGPSARLALACTGSQWLGLGRSVAGMRECACRAAALATRMQLDWASQGASFTCCLRSVVVFYMGIAFPCASVRWTLPLARLEGEASSGSSGIGSLGSFGGFGSIGSIGSIGSSLVGCTDSTTGQWSDAERAPFAVRVSALRGENFSAIRISKAKAKGEQNRTEPNRAEQKRSEAAAKHKRKRSNKFAAPDKKFDRLDLWGPTRDAESKTAPKQSAPNIKPIGPIEFDRRLETN